jgi:hypothetical protein
MTKTPLPFEVTQFIKQAIVSVEQAEILLFLQRDPDRLWSSHQIALRLHYHPASVDSRLEDLCGKHLCVRVDTGEKCYRYQPVRKIDADLVRAFEQAYRTYRDLVIALIVDANTDL